jgi:hypothetical protein
MENLKERIERVISRAKKMSDGKIFIMLADAEFEIEKAGDNYSFFNENKEVKCKTIFELKQKIYEKFNVFYFKNDEYNIEIEVRETFLFFVASDVTDDSQAVFAMSYEELEKLKKMVANR